MSQQPSRLMRGMVATSWARTLRFAVLGVMATTSARAATLSVDPVSGSDAGACTTSACASIGYALTQAAAGDQIDLAAGTYAGTLNRNLVPPVADLRIVGAGRENTIIDIQEDGNGFIFEASAGAPEVSDLTLINGNCSAGIRPNGGGFYLVQSSAIIRRVTLRNMNCVDDLAPPAWSGAGFFLQDSTALIEECEVYDSIANHGGSVATWGTEQSTFNDCKFIRTGGINWGGAVLNEEQTLTEFHRCYFTGSYNDYGAVMDDGATASPLYNECIFEYNYGRLGSVGYHYGDSLTRWTNCIMRHNTQLTGVLYINANTKVTVKNCSFINNSATEEAGAIRAHYAGRQGKMVIDSCTFINNSAAGFGGVATVRGSHETEFRDCYFEGNLAAGLDSGAIRLTVAPSVIEFPLDDRKFLTRSRFVRNIAKTEGSALTILALDEGVSGITVEIEDTIFEDNVGRDGPAISMNSAFAVRITNSTFRRNKAANRGGAIWMRNPSGKEAKATIIDSELIENVAVSQGGAVQCVQAPGGLTSLVLENTMIKDNQILGDGGGIYFDCSILNMTGGSVEGNVAQSGNGGALTISAQTMCGDSSNPMRIQDVSFVSNQASVGGGLVFFDHINPSCRLPLPSEQSDTWVWSDMDAMVTGNTASYGDLQATAPALLNVECANESSTDARGSRLSGCRTELNGVRSTVVYDTAFPGMEAELIVTMVDDFGQKIEGGNGGAGVQIQSVIPEGSPFKVQGLQKFWFDAGQALASGFEILGGNKQLLELGVNETLMIKVPDLLVDLSYIPPAEIALNFGICPAGWVPRDPEATTGYYCGPCAVGKYAALGDQVCSTCPAGTYSDRPGRWSCIDCPEGHKCPQGSTTPIACSEGQFQPALGMEECMRCEVGTYQSASGATACESCNGDRKTAGLGAVLLDECACEENSYSVDPNSPCLPCPEGMFCAFGSDLSFWGQGENENISTSHPYPVLTKGFYSRVDDPLSVFKCPLETACPGGDPGHCGGEESDSFGFMCIECGKGNYFESGVCHKCEWHHSMLWVITFFLGFVGLLYLARMSALALTVQSPQMVIVVIIVGQLLYFLQMSAALNKLPINWTDPFQTFVKLLAVFNFGVDAFKVDCIDLGGDVNSFLFQVLSPVLFVACFMVIFGVLRAVKPGALSFDGLFNSLGQLGTALYIAFTIVVLMPFHCYEHPNGDFSVVSYPAVMCQGGEHAKMVIIGILGVILYPVFVICLVFYAVWRYPKMIVSSDTSFLFRFRFVFFRWSPECYWFSAVVVIRNLMVSLLPMTIPIEDSDITTALMVIVLLVVLGLSSQFSPWRSKEMNYLDLGLNFVLVITTAIGSMALTTVESNELSTGLCNLLFVCNLVILVGGIGYALFMVYSAFRPINKYSAFLSHHKGAGACAARLLKYMMQRELNRPIFYDCDDLTSFEGIFVAVKMSDAVVVMMSGETLCRPWCAGEIVTAHENGIPMIPVSLGGAEERWEKFTGKEQEALIGSQFEILRSHGIAPEVIRVAFDILLSKDPIILPLCSGSKVLADTVQVLVASVGKGRRISGDFSGILGTSSRKNSTTSEDGIEKIKTGESMKLPSVGKEESHVTSNRSSSAADLSAKVLVMSDTNNSEASSCAHLFRQMLQERLQTSIAVDLDISTDAFATSLDRDTLSTVIFVLYPGSTLQSATQLVRLGILYKYRPQCQLMPIIVGESFLFPDQVYFDRLEKGLHPFSSDIELLLPSQVTTKDVCEAVRWAFRGIAKFINVAYSNQAVLNAGLNALADRVKGMATNADIAGQREGGVSGPLSWDDHIAF